MDDARPFKKEFVSKMRRLSDDLHQALTTAITSRDLDGGSEKKAWMDVWWMWQDEMSSIFLEFVIEEIAWSSIQLCRSIRRQRKAMGPRKSRRVRVTCVFESRAERSEVGWLVVSFRL